MGLLQEPSSEAEPSLAILPPINVSLPPHNIARRVLRRHSPNRLAVVRGDTQETERWRQATPRQTLTAATHRQRCRQRLPQGAAHKQGRGGTAVKALLHVRQELSRTCFARMQMRLRTVVQYAIEWPPGNIVLPAQRARRWRCRWRACRHARRRWVRPQACSSCPWKCPLTNGTVCRCGAP